MDQVPCGSRERRCRSRGADRREDVHGESEIDKEEDERPELAEEEIQNESVGIKDAELVHAGEEESGILPGDRRSDRGGREGKREDKGDGRNEPSGERSVKKQAALFY